jgi:ABC-type polysaccharide/polyol phosphate transport system ATPase subunit
MPKHPTEAIRVEHVSKRFRIISIRRQATLKEAIVGLEIPWMRRGARFVQAVDDISFSVPRGGTLGILGKNGSGKTTLMRLLAGVYTPDRGSVRVSGLLAPLLTLGIGFHSEMSGRENLRISGLVLGLTPRQVERRANEIIDFAELREFIDSPVRTYSSGMYMRLAFSVAISVDPDVLLLDEVLSVGDEAFAAKCLARMKEFKTRKKTIVLVTHDASLIASWCDSALWIDRGKARMQGPAHEVVDAYHREMHGPPPDAALRDESQLESG